MTMNWKISAVVALSLLSSGIVNCQTLATFGHPIKDLFRYNNEYRKFYIELECDVGINDAVSVRFNSTNTSENRQMLNLSAQSQASGVGIKIQDASGRLLTFGEPSSSKEVIAGMNNLEYIAFVTRRSDSLVLSDIGLGTFEASATFEIIYD